MIYERHVNTLKPGSKFRAWLLEIMGEKIKDKSCNVFVHKIEPASHTICRYEFKNEGKSVVAKFFGEPQGWNRFNHPVDDMENEFAKLIKVGQIIDVPKPIATRRDFNCVLLTEYVNGVHLYRYIREEDHLFDRLTALAHTLRRLHDETRSGYLKEREFARFHKVLDQTRIDRATREVYNCLLGKWWYSPFIDLDHGSTIHSDANPVNYIFKNEKLFALDFESSRDYANFVYDIGIVAAELKNFFGWKRKNAKLAEPYIGHFIWRYSKDEEEFKKITEALPFFMSLGLLRITRFCMSTYHREYLFKEATACLMAIDRI